VRLASEGGFAGAVLDAGCGTGENALHVASLGLSVLGVDVATAHRPGSRQSNGSRLRDWARPGGHQLMAVGQDEA
jgi:predicted RNA methylase